MTACLNWRELKLYLDQVKPELEHFFVDRVIVPERPRFPASYIKGEWAIRLAGRKKDAGLLLSVRPRHPYLAYYEGKGAKASSQATRSAFDLSLGKQIKGKRVLEIQSLPQERIAVIWFAGCEDPHSRLGLVLVLIPAVPEALLITAPQDKVKCMETSQWKVIARSRTVKQNSESFSLPQASQAPQEPPVRGELVGSSLAFGQHIEEQLSIEGFNLRVQAAQKHLRQLLKQAQDRIRQSETGLKEAEKEPNWQLFGDLLKGSLGSPSPCVNSEREVENFHTGLKVKIPCDPRLSLIAQIEKFYQNARRRQRRAQEAQVRMDRFQEAKLQIESALNRVLPPGSWSDLEKLERFSGIQAPSAAPKRTGPSWIGKSFVSRDQLMIWVGRNKDENLELTFKMAKGNDLWLHVRGRPGSHVIVPLQPGKSAPLETLLDAAHLVIYYSGGANWGKTEVDYTYKKYVKRIKNSTEASYTHNKTLIVEPDPQRLKRLLDQNA